MPVGTCPKCGKELERKNTKGTWYCRECFNAYKREWRKTRLDRGASFRSFLGERAAGYRRRAKKLNVPYELDYDYLDRLWQKQKGRCFYTGKKMTYFTSSSNGYAKKRSASLDRLNPRRGYVRGNVVWVTYFANTAKGNLTHQQFLDFCQAVLQRQNVHAELSNKVLSRV